MNVTVDQCLTGRHQKTQVTSYQVPTVAKILNLNCTEVAKSRGEGRVVVAWDYCHCASKTPPRMCVSCPVLLEVTVSKGWQGCVPHRESGRIYALVDAPGFLGTSPGTDSIIQSPSQTQSPPYPYQDPCDFISPSRIIHHNFSFWKSAVEGLGRQLSWSSVCHTSIRSLALSPKPM